MTAAVLFDLYETLVTERNAPPTRAASLGERLGLDAAAYKRAWKPQRARIVRGEISFADALLEICAAAGRPVDSSVVHALSEERGREKAAVLQRIDQEVLAVLNRLRLSGCRLAVISNCLPEDVDAWSSCPAAEYFDAPVFSYAVGAVKPEARIYQEALRRLDVKADSALYVGDGGDDELRGAEAAGVRAGQAAWFVGERQDLPARIPRLTSWNAVLDCALSRS